MRSFVVLSLAGLTACAGVPVALPPQAQQACTVVSWGVPIVQGLQAAGKLNPNAQATLADAEAAVSACASGNVPATIAAVAEALTAVIYPPAT